MSPNWNSADCCNIAGALSWQAGKQADTPAIYYPTGMRGGEVQYLSCSYRELDDLSNSYARGLREFGISRGARVALMMPPGRDMFALFFALFKAGAVPVLIDPGIGLKPLKHCLAEAAPEAFIGVSRAQAARAVLGWAPESIKKLITDGPRMGWGGISCKQLMRMGERTSGPILEATRPGEMAAILFTSGSTGIPKGVVYRHGQFTAQVGMLKSAFGINEGEIDLPTFAPFALFDPALGMTTVIPWMNPTKPAKANPKLLVQAIQRFGVSNIFGSPALLRVLAGYTDENNIKLPTVKRVLSAGAAVPIELIRTMKKALNEDARIYTPYGATECLPVTCISDEELSDEIATHTLKGDGICVGKPVQPNQLAIVGIKDEVIDQLDSSMLMPTGVAGEVIVHGPTTTDAYWRREEQTRLAKITDEQGRLWHRMGDIGYLDDAGMLWYCGRKTQRIELEDDVLFADQMEAVFNAHPEVARTALVGVSIGGETRAVLCVELDARPNAHRRERIRTDLLQIASSNSRLRPVQTILFHPRFPVDIRHNAKIGREKLALWAVKKLK